MKTVIFDLDGTLADTSGDLIAAANACFREMGVGDKLDPVADASVAFRGGRAMLSLGASRMDNPEDDLVERWFAPFIEFYTDAIDVHTYLYPGVMDCVQTLRTSGYAVGICTNKPERQTEILLASLGVRDAFASMVAADTLPVRKPDPQPLIEAVRRAGGDITQSVLIGDTVTDRETARNAGVPSVLVTFGPDGEGVLSLKPEASIAHYDELPGVVARLIG